MKVNKYSRELTKLKLLKTRELTKLKQPLKTKIYKKGDHSFTEIENIFSRVKKVLHIIFQYLINKKRILFVGTPFHLNKKLENLIKNTKHTYIPESVWMNGILTNQSSCFKYLLKNQKSINRKISTILFKTKKKSDLIVIFNSPTNSNALDEGYLTRTPIISLNLDLDNSDTKSSYKIPSIFKSTKKITRNDFFCSLLPAAFTKADRYLRWLQEEKEQQQTNKRKKKHKKDYSYVKKKPARF